MTTNEAEPGRGWGLVVGALGVVYGDIGTSPLYALRACFHGSHAFALTEANVYGVVSLIIWALVFIVSIKYVMFVLRADNRGEGGVLALLALASRRIGSTGRGRAGLVAAGVFGAALLYGDGMITPAISVLGAIEGLEVATPLFRPWIVPITILALVALFSVQRVGTGRVGNIFGPVMLIWFLSLILLGLRGLVLAPRMLFAINPYHGVMFFVENGWAGSVVLGAVVLAVTGAESLYADLGHFGATPIRKAWFLLVFPALVVNYLGQGSLLLADPEAAQNPFFRLAPGWALYPLVALAALAAIIAAQALISGAFSLTTQAIQLGYLPRLEIRHTSPDERGQIYVPLVNELLLVCCVGLVLGFQSSNNLAAAYGVAVTLIFPMTTVLYYFAARYALGWSAARALGLCALFGVVELILFSANALKILHGGWFPLAVAVVLYTVMSTWHNGRRRLSERLASSMLPLEMFLDNIRQFPPIRVPGTAVYMSGSRHGTPLALLHNLNHNKVLHQRTVLLTIVTAERPHVPASDRVQLETFPDGLWRVIANFGFMDRPTVGAVLKACASQGLEMRLRETTFFLSRETIVMGTGRWPKWRQRLFAYLARNAQSATAFFGLPRNRVVELGMQVEA